MSFTNFLRTTVFLLGFLVVLAGESEIVFAKEPNTSPIDGVSINATQQGAYPSPLTEVINWSYQSVYNSAGISFLVFVDGTPIGPTPDQSTIIPYPFIFVSTLPLSTAITLLKSEFGLGDEFYYAGGKQITGLSGGVTHSGTLSIPLGEVSPGPHKIAVVAHAWELQPATPVFCIPNIVPITGFGGGQNTGIPDAGALGRYFECILLNIINQAIANNGGTYLTYDFMYTPQDFFVSGGGAPSVTFKLNGQEADISVPTTSTSFTVEATGTNNPTNCFLETEDSAGVASGYNSLPCDTYTTAKSVKPSDFGFQVGRNRMSIYMANGVGSSATITRYIDVSPVPVVSMLLNGAAQDISVSLTDEFSLGITGSYMTSAFNPTQCFMQTIPASGVASAYNPFPCALYTIPVSVDPKASPFNFSQGPNTIKVYMTNKNGSSAEVNQTVTLTPVAVNTCPNGGTFPNCNPVQACSNGGVFPNCNPTPQPALGVLLRANKNSPLPPNTNVDLTWTTTGNPAACTGSISAVADATSAWINPVSKNVNGSTLTVKLPNASQTYTITCTRGAETAQSSVSFTNAFKIGDNKCEGNKGENAVNSTDCTKGSIREGV